MTRDELVPLCAEHRADAIGGCPMCERDDLARRLAQAALVAARAWQEAHAEEARADKAEAELATAQARIVGLEANLGVTKHEYDKAVRDYCKAAQERAEARKLLAMEEAEAEQLAAEADRLLPFEREHYAARATIAALRSALETILKWHDSDPVRGAFAMAAAHGLTATREVADAADAMWQAARAALAGGAEEGTNG